MARAEPASVDTVVCPGGALVVSLASGGTAGDVDWVAFVRAGATWRVVQASGGYQLGIFVKNGDLEVVQPVFRRADSNCCPTGGFDRTLYTVRGDTLVDLRQWHTPRFVKP